MVSAREGIAIGIARKIGSRGQVSARHKIDFALKLGARLSPRIRDGNRNRDHGTPESLSLVRFRIRWRRSSAEGAGRSFKPLVNLCCAQILWLCSLDTQLKLVLGLFHPVEVVIR